MPPYPPRPILPLPPTPQELHVVFALPSGMLLMVRSSHKLTSDPLFTKDLPTVKLLPTHCITCLAGGSVPPYPPPLHTSSHSAQLAQLPPYLPLPLSPPPLPPQPPPPLIAQEAQLPPYPSPPNPLPPPPPVPHPPLLRLNCRTHRCVCRPRSRVLIHPKSHPPPPPVIRLHRRRCRLGQLQWLHTSSYSTHEAQLPP